MYEGIDTVVLHNELACQDHLPVLFRGLSRPPPIAETAALTERNIRTLQVCAMLEEQGALEKSEEKSLHSADMLRLEAKLNLVLDLLGQVLAAQTPRPAPVPIRFNALGATWMSQKPPRPGELGLLEIYLRDSLPQPLVLLANVTSVSTDGQVKATFAPPGEVTADLLEKLAFRRHRRQIAGVRQPRRSGSETGITRTLG
jgi:hypothetical protein